MTLRPLYRFIRHDKLYGYIKLISNINSTVKQISELKNKIKSGYKCTSDQKFDEYYMH